MQAQQRSSAELIGIRPLLDKIIYVNQKILLRRMN